MTKREMDAHVRAIRRRVEARLPEDEPDDVARWVYEDAVSVMADHFGTEGVHVWTSRHGKDVCRVCNVERVRGDRVPPCRKVTITWHLTRAPRAKR